MRTFDHFDEISVGTVLQCRIDGIYYPWIGRGRSIPVPINSILLVVETHYRTDGWFDVDCFFDGKKIEVSGRCADFNLL